MARSHRLILVALVAVGLFAWAELSGPRHQASSGAGTAGATFAGAAPALPSAQPVMRATPDSGSTQAALDETGEPLGALDCDAPEGDVARVDGQPITAAELCAAWRMLSGSVQRGDPVAMDRQAKQWLERKIDALLVARALAADGRTVSEATVDAALDAVVERHDRRTASKPTSGAAKVDARKALEAELKSTGSTLDQVREDLREQLALKALVEHRERFEATDAIVERAYAADPARFGTPRTAAVEGFLARAPEGAAANERKKALDLATAFATRVANGESVEAAVVPELQHIPRFEVSTAGPEPQLAAAAFRLAPDGWSLPVQTRAGYVVMRLIEIREGQARPLSEVRELVKQHVQGEHTVAARERILAALRKAAKIEYLQW